MPKIKLSNQQTNKISSSFAISNIISDPFAISMLSVALISWIIIFAGSIASSLDGSFPKFTWWGIVYELVLLIFLFLFYLLDIVESYKTFLTAGFSIAFIYTTNSATNLVYSDGSKKAAASAGAILLSMVNLIWVFYFGGDSSSPTNQWIDSFSLRGPRPSSRDSYISERKINENRISSFNNNPNTFNTERPSVTNSKYVSSTRLNGLENFSERENISSPTQFNTHDEGTNISQQTANTEYLNSNLVIDDFPYTARALYSYESNPDDENEISFEKDEILKVNDIHSRWWQAKRSNGQIGICPSNYVELIE
ncbi:hypothetical protein WICMUC_005502 [Wickerhamomyces mucosus]|uniref:High osmolarity signaling protein SHO1 n=1 Tax=Wickerhamomyces mucosus TaxID=1378264 RepID=A0A9P8P7Z3_9ASCO|nr:hypothetical protein WICMUC_005502 [Wickerhamomyces mucosus]